MKERDYLLAFLGSICGQNPIHHFPGTIVSPGSERNPQEIMNQAILQALASHDVRESDLVDLIKDLTPSTTTYKKLVVSALRSATDEDIAKEAKRQRFWEGVEADLRKPVGR